MRWVRDETGRLPLRPHFRPDEIDAECERLVGAFRRAGRGPGRADASPLSTDDLTVLLEQVTDDLDLYADLSAEGQDTEGVTDFFPGQRPRVRIAPGSARAGAGSTACAPPWPTSSGTSASTTASGRSTPVRPRRSTRAAAGRASSSPPATDWLEWQAGYACGALLMPAGTVSRLVDDLLQRTGRRPPLLASGTLAGTLVRRVARAFDVSLPAARTRLFKLGHLTAYTGRPAPSRAPARRRRIGARLQYGRR